MSITLAIGGLLAFLLYAMPLGLAKEPEAFRIGILTTAWSPWHSNTKGFRDALKELGYVEGQNINFMVRAAKGDPTRLPGLAAELVAQKPDLLYCVAGPDAQACKKATATIPTVFTQVSDPVALGRQRPLSAGSISNLCRPSSSPLPAASSAFNIASSVANSPSSSTNFFAVAPGSRSDVALVGR